MSNRNDIVNELKELNSPLADMSKIMPYEVPAGYFDRAADDFIQYAQSADMPEAMLMASKAMPYEVPTGYFEQLPATIIAKVKDANKPATIIPLHKPVWKQIRWVAAAILLLAIGIGGYEYTQRGYNPQNELAKLSADSIHEYVQQHIDEYDMEMIADNMETNDLKSLDNSISEQEIVNYLNATGWDEPAIN